MLRMSTRALDPTRAAMRQETWTFAMQRAATGTALNDTDAYSRNVAWAVRDGGTIFTSTDCSAPALCLVAVGSALQPFDIRRTVICRGRRAGTTDVCDRTE